MDDPPRIRSKPRLWKPLVGMAICICVFVLALLIGVMTLCGSGAGYNRDGNLPQAAQAALVVVILLPMAGFAGCVIWLLVAAIRNALSDD